MRKWITLVGAWLLTTLTAATAQTTGIAAPQLAGCDAAVQEFMQRWDIPGASVAISKDGRLVYERGFGYADLARTEPMRPAHLLRVASVSKPVTAVAILKLAEQGRVALNHRVFGPEGYLQSAYYLDVIQDKRIYDITVRQLLEHTGGWNRNAGVDNLSSSDPIDFPLHVARTMQASNPVADTTLLRFVLSRGLNFAPGSRFAYSNMGYLVLGKIIEQVTGRPYAAWVQDNIFRPADILEAHLGRNLLTDKQEREAEYFSKRVSESCYGTGQKVAMPYGGWNLEAMGAHGGWLFSARDLVRFMLAVDGNPSRPDLLTATSIDTMTTSDEPNRRYAKGWLVNKDRSTWWHTGSLDGTASCVVRTAAGYTWAILLNGRAVPNRFWHDLEELGWDCLRAADNRWPAYDLFAPAQNASRLQAKTLSPTAARLSWRNGSGTDRLLILQEQAPVTELPQDGTNYVAATSFGQGASLGRAAVVAAGPDSLVTVRDLLPGRTYFARLVEYRQDTITGQHPVYALDGNPVLEFRTPAQPQVVAKATKPAKRGKTTRHTASTRRRSPKPTAPAAVKVDAKAVVPAASNGERPAAQSYWARLWSAGLSLLK
ncbi:class A beta-lactamase-related serine hydrolase [Hymenobacter gummosus]|uniref:Class A beta-lactamase-related serine hydrolase n=1 Tax=Hymenobacter gummosus TaxID=1776032 RepID=A0A3S0H884_9BACT|nr:serine hydrolase domain-containing protein [Hymenobacter gummosus]RTQ48560.1 class A beta-lactamase-related serine hydrolase [Hymenobacter gummosus]